MADLKLANVKKSYGKVDVLEGINLEIQRGEFIAFVGPSGCGKSTLLRLIAGLERISGGDLMIDGQRMNDVPPAQRGIAMVFQSYALYPHMTVYQNMEFGLKLAKLSKQDIESRVREAAGILKLTDYLDRLPKQLSGGQRQRVAIDGRSFVIRKCSCLMSLCRTWTLPCVFKRVLKLRSCIEIWARRPWSMSPTTKWRP